MKSIRSFAVMLTICFLLDVTGGAAAEKKPAVKKEVVKQEEFAADLVTALGWEAGLPEKPRDKDYLAILSGKRVFRFEAEDVYDVKNDNVSVRNYSLYGSFTGRGWVSGVAVPTIAHFKVFIPLEGSYNLIGAAKGDGQKWQAGGKEFTVSTGGKLSEAVAGAIPLKAGVQELNVVIPPDGGVDYFVLEGLPLPPVEPVGGWHMQNVLKMGELAEITAALLDLEKQLPDDPTDSTKTLSAADVTQLPPTVKTTTIGYLGKFIAKQWVRADYRGAQLEIPFSVENSAVYGLKIRLLGKELTAELDGRKIIRPAKPYLDWVDLGYFRLERGTHKLLVELTTNGGIDVVQLTGKKSSPAEYMAVCGMKGDPEAPVKRPELDKILASLVERFKGRK